ncbi:VCBS repeat-containing protein [Streptomyces sp. NPDC097619]|uniref:VCBS repeat-containing protein n=1 Tax=Streptomyces sp. NPDC097619 TaxID=3157228 RepID=UPI00331B38BF
MLKSLRRLSATAVVAMVVGAANVVPATAVSADEPLKLVARDEVAPPGGHWYPYPDVAQGDLVRGTMVFALSTSVLDGTSAAGDPAAVIKEFALGNCKTVPRLTAVYTCAYSPSAPFMFFDFEVRDNVPDMTTVYAGYANVAPGGDLTAGIKAAQTAAARPADANHGVEKLTVKTQAHAALNTVDRTLPPVPAGRMVRHTLRLHAKDAGELHTYFLPSPGQPHWGQADIRIGDVKTSTGLTCEVVAARIADGSRNLDCDASQGEHTIEYTLTVPAGLPTWKMDAHSMYNIYTHPVPGPSNGWIDTHSTFTVGTGPRHDRHQLLTTDGGGKMYSYFGTGKAATPFNRPAQVGTGWQGYNTVTKLEPIVEDLGYAPETTTPGRGDVVARDASGTLWKHTRQTYENGPFNPRTKVGTGWGIYTTLTGSADLTGDGKSDLLARDKTGTLWLYRATGKTTVPFAPRTRIGSGWNTYTSITGGSDLTNDEKPDLLARDTAGALWLYKGTGNTSKPFTTRTKIGTGWGTYNQLSLTGDLTNDGKSDLLARDTAGALWLHKGTGNASAAFANRTKIGTGWGIYNRIL